MKKNYAVDTHCHLTFIDKQRRKSVIERALKGNVKKLISVSCNTDEIDQGLTLANEYDFRYFSSLTL